MAVINFPDPAATNPNTGNPNSDGWYNSGNGVTYQYSNGLWTAANDTSPFEDIFVEVDGDTMTGALKLPADPTSALEASTKQYVDNEISSAISTSEGDETGRLDGRYLRKDAGGGNQTLLSTGWTNFTGRVGVGYGNPQGALQVATGAANFRSIVLDNSDLEIGTNAHIVNRINSIIPNTAEPEAYLEIASYQTHFKTRDATNALVIDIAGRVGIGDSSNPVIVTQKLEVNGAIAALSAAQTLQKDGIYLQNKGAGFFDIGCWRTSANVSILTLSTSPGSVSAPLERLRIDQNGNVGIDRPINLNNTFELAGPALFTNADNVSEQTSPLTDSGLFITNNNATTNLTSYPLIGLSSDKIDSYSSINVWRKESNRNIGLSFSCANGGSSQEKLWLDPDGSLLLKTYNNLFVPDGVINNPTSRKPAVHISASSYASTTHAISFYHPTVTNGAGSLCFTKSKTDQESEHGAVANNEVLGKITFAGSDGTKFIESASIYSQTETVVIDNSDPSNNEISGTLVLATNKDTEGAEGRVFISPEGFVGINKSNPISTLDVIGNTDISGSVRIGNQDPVDPPAQVDGLLRLVTSSGKSYIQSGPTYSSGAKQDLTFTGMLGTPSVMTIVMEGGIVLNDQGEKSGGLSIGVNDSRGTLDIKCTKNNRRAIFRTGQSDIYCELAFEQSDGSTANVEYSAYSHTFNAGGAGNDVIEGAVTIDGLGNFYAKNYRIDQLDPI